MKIIACWQDLAPYGIEPLTGEACGLMYRILFDATEKGRRVLAKAFGIPNLQLAEAWNSGSKEEPHVGSIMLTAEMLRPLSIFALLESGCDEVYGCKDCVVGFDATDSPVRRQRYLEHHRDQPGRRYAYAGTAGDRNVHVMSGRID